MPRTVTTYLRLLNLCAMHKVDVHTIAGLMAVNALAAMDFETLGYWSKVADIETRRQAI
ncbi:MAG: hypothetical protein ACYCZX_02605 [Rhodospirillaceae bacterium]